MTKIETRIAISLQDALNQARLHARTLERVIEGTGDSELMEIAYAIDAHFETLVHDELAEVASTLGPLHYAEDQDIDEALDELDPDLN